MGFIQNLINRYATTPQIKEASVPFAPVNSTVAFSQNLSKEAQLEQYKSWTYAAVSKIANDCGNVEITLNKMDERGEVEQVDKHEALDLLDFGNPFSTLSDIIETTIMYQLLAGDAFWWIIKDGSGKPVEIWQYLRPDLMNVIPSATEFIKGYKYNVPGEGKVINFDVDDIIMFKKPNPLDPYRGLSPVKAAQFAIATDSKASEWNWRFFHNSARPDTVISFEDGLTESQAKQVKTQWENMHKGTEHSQKTAFISKGTVTQIGMSQKDMDFLEQRRFSRDEILAMFKVPKALLDPQEINFASANVAKQVYIEQVVEPEMKRLCNTLNEFLLPFYNDDSLFFDYISPQETDRETQLKSYEILSKVGAISPNEIRQMEGLESIEGGDDIRPQVGVNPDNVLGKGKRFKKKHNIRIKSRSTTAEMVAKIKKELKGSKAFETKKKLFLKPVSKKSDRELLKEKLKIKHIKLLDKDEQKIKKEIVDLFKEQEKQVIKQLYKKDVGDVDIDIAEEALKFRKRMKPIVANLILLAGNRALGDIGVDEELIISSAITTYIDKEGLEFCKDIQKTTRDKISKQIAEGIKQGEGTTVIAQRIRNVYSEATTSRANMISRTETAKDISKGSIEAWKQSEVVKGQEWITFDPCPICEPLDGISVKLGESFPGGYDKPGDTHPNCECALMPVIITKAERLNNLKLKKDNK